MEEQAEVGTQHGSVPNTAVSNEAGVILVYVPDGNEAKIKEVIDTLPEGKIGLPHGNGTQSGRLSAGGLYSVRDIQILFRISRRTVSNWQTAGILKPRKVGGIVYYLRQDVEALVASK